MPHRVGRHWIIVLLSRTSFDLSQCYCATDFWWPRWLWCRSRVRALLGGWECGITAHNVVPRCPVAGEERISRVPPICCNL